VTGSPTDVAFVTKNATRPHGAEVGRRRAIATGKVAVLSWAAAARYLESGAGPHQE
jgi:hypothetical protein